MTAENHPPADRGSARRVLVTGGASGIGRAYVERCQRRGDRVAMIDVVDPSDDVTPDVFARADVADPAAIVDAVEGCAHTLGGLDVVVAAAGVEGPTALAEDLPLADWNRVLAVNSTGVFLTYKAVLPHLRRAGGGALCAVASIYAFLGAADAAAYCASKGALVQLVRSLAAAHGRERIRVSCVCPGTTDTPMLAPHVATPESKRRTEEANLHGRLIRPDEIAAAIDYLVSDEAASVIGAALVVDGGLTVVR